MLKFSIGFPIIYGNNGKTLVVCLEKIANCDNFRFEEGMGPNFGQKMGKR